MLASRVRLGFGLAPGWFGVAAQRPPSRDGWGPGHAYPTNVLRRFDGTTATAGADRCLIQETPERGVKRLPRSRRPGTSVSGGIICGVPWLGGWRFGLLTLVLGMFGVCVSPGCLVAAVSYWFGSRSWLVWRGCPKFPRPSRSQGGRVGPHNETTATSQFAGAPFAISLLLVRLPVAPQQRWPGDEILLGRIML